MVQSTDQTHEPYMLAQFVLAALDSGDEALVDSSAARLASLARDERGGAYWDLQTNSPFYGWGIAGRYVTTGLVVSALAAWRTRAHAGYASGCDHSTRISFPSEKPGCWRAVGPPTQATLRAMSAPRRLVLGVWSDDWPRREHPGEDKRTSAQEHSHTL